jgi:hypothetical protein
MHRGISFALAPTCCALPGCPDGVEIPVLPASSIAETLTDSGLVGDGTFGAVYLLESATNMVVKVFKPACDDETRLHEIMCLGCVCVCGTLCPLHALQQTPFLFKNVQVKERCCAFIHMVFCNVAPQQAAALMHSFIWCFATLHRSKLQHLPHVAHIVAVLEEMVDGAAVCYGYTVHRCVRDCALSFAMMAAKHNGI